MSYSLVGWSNFHEYWRRGGKRRGEGGRRVRREKIGGRRERRGRKERGGEGEERTEREEKEKEKREGRGEKGEKEMGK